MRTQNLQMNMTQQKLDPILFRTEETGREIEFTLLDPDGTAYDLTDYELKFTMLKPDGNVIYQDLSAGILTQTEQMTTSRGIGYYAIRVSDQDTLIYTGQGKVVIDDHVITDETLNSISEVDGLVFPDDFITVEDHVAVIDDTVTSTEKTWSSSKISDEIENASVIVSKTAEGNPIELSDAADAPLVKCVTAITGYQIGAGTPSPDNVRPIVAYTEGEIEVRGKNMLNPNSAISYGSGSSTYSVSGNAINVATSGQYSGIVFDKELPNGTYSISFSFKFNNSGTASVAIMDEDNTTSLWTTGEFSSDTTRSGKFTVTHGIAHIRFYCTRSNASGNVTISNLMLNTGSSSENYEEYRCTTHTTSYPSAIYRGSEDVVNGKVTSDRIKAVFDGSIDEDWRANSGYPTQFAVSLNEYNVKLVGSAYAEFAIGNMYDKHDVSASQRENGDMSIYNGTWSGSSGVWLAVRDDRFTTLADFKAAIATTPIEIAYELATPTTSSVTPTNLPIKSLLGYNRIESTTGNMEIEYITEDYQPLVDSIVTESKSNITKLWDAGFTPAPGVWLEYDFGEDLEDYDAIVIEFVVSGWEGNNSDVVTVYPKIQHLNTKHCYHYVKGTDYGTHVWHVSGTTYALGAISGNYPPQYKAVYGIKY